MRKVLFLILIYIIGSIPLVYGQKETNLRVKLKYIDSIQKLANNYEKLNDFNTALSLYQKAHDQRLLMLPADSNLVVASLIKLSETSLNLNNLDAAKEYLKKVSNIVSTNPVKYSSLNSSVALMNAKIYERVYDIDKANQYYQQYFDYAQKEKFTLNSQSYIDALTKMSLFYAFNYGPKKAFKYAHLAIDITKKGRFKNTTVHLKAIQNIANMYFGFSNYAKGQQFSEEGLQLFHEYLNINKNIREQVEVEKLVPYLIWINTKSKYFLNPEKDIAFLRALAKQMDQGIEILNRNKEILLNPEDINVLFERYGLFFSFTKQLQLDLYEATGNYVHLDRLIQLHESIRYTKIRKRLNSIKKLEFNGVPKEILSRQAFLKENLNTSLRHPGYKNSDFVRAEKEWSIFLDSLKLNFPKYHSVNYASVEQKIEDSRELIKNDETLIRYLHIEKRLYAIIISKTEKDIVALPYINLKLYNAKIREHQNNSIELNPILNTLYYHIWEPIKDKVKTSNIVVIPDGELFNLNFELLTASKINSFRDLALKGLLAQYIISYNYSLLLKDNNQKPIEFDKDFIAYAPAFNNNMKADYELAITDSVNLDKTYLTLLPQPFSANIVEKFSKKFNGTQFLNGKASKQIFTKNAKEHKIIHIGTHAESNNVNPELSRLVFAKNVSDSTSINDNYLYTYEIYNQNLSSNLAILTACETGKPTYQPGEGMISLAHAFNYAGSESILTSLWQIDEQSSTQILEYFY
ncbi:MAG: CHAT domain-containing protein, partial [Maribacter sp.]